MSEVLDSATLFRQLQSRYPSSCLVTELVQIHAETFIVRALVQVGSTILASAMAGATTIEQAEDQARLRVLSLVGVAVNSGIPATSGFQPIPGFPPLPPPVHPATPLSDPFSSPLPPNSSPLPDLPASPVGASLVGDRAIAPPLSGFTSPAAIPALDAPEAIAEISSNFPEPEETLPPPETKRDPRPRKPAARKDAEVVVSPEPVAPEAEDRSELIAQISVEIERIGWSRKRGSEYLQKTYGKKTRGELDDVELVSFLSYLKAHPSSSEVPFSD
jgi:hypothetical protein